VPAEAKRIRAVEAPLPGRIRCAIYTRKSTDEGLDQPFNSLDAQRESAESYIRSQKDTGWFALADRYDDGGFTGANMDRPALKRLLADVDVYKVGHHGSLNATPRKLLWAGFRKRNRNGKDRLKALLSTLPGKHGKKANNTEVPRTPLLEALQRETDLQKTNDLKFGAAPELCHKVVLSV
jgi:hypothetical protein